ncbi:hypothetical protein OUZ56_029861 [Daphnia magna]|uniref:Uncharacterized protein n=1 Tax=Daphnia magna TaxID=35525 RepID=A0ABR0B833_9CRUS|nr:hypothetical protein OUZ56_029861 [Daphnia magna]
MYKLMKLKPMLSPCIHIEYKSKKSWCYRKYKLMKYKLMVSQSEPFTMVTGLNVNGFHKLLASSCVDYLTSNPAT